MTDATPTIQTISLSDAEGTAFPAYVSHPEGAPRGAVVVIHEIWGLVDHITDVADRFARAGYLAVAPDLLGRIGIEPHIGLELAEIMFSSDEKVKSEGQPRLRDALAPLQSPEFAASALASLVAAVDWVADQDGVGGRIAVAGFCFGGTYSFTLAAADDRIRAAVPFYGQGPSPDAVGELSCPVLALYGRNDPSLMEALPALQAAAEAAGAPLSTHVYEGTGHAFFNDTNSITYDRPSADDAWSRTLAFLESNLA